MVRKAARKGHFFEAALWQRPCCYGLASAANPKFAQVCGALGRELRVQKRHYKDKVASVLIDSEVRTSVPKMLTNFGIGTLGSRRERNCGLFTRTSPVKLQFACSIALPCRILGESL